jgi:hypothetical protein
MDLDLATLLAAFAGGMFGAALGALMAFVFTGFMVLVGVAVALSGVDFDFLGLVAFGPVFGPHISFAGGVAAVAAAKRMNLLEDGDAKNIAEPLIGLAAPVVLFVGGIFGLGGHVVEQLLAEPAGLGEWTDTVALVVGLSCIVSRFAFGSSGLLGDLTPDAEQRGRWVPGGDQVWVAFQQGLGQVSALGLGGGLLFAWVVATAHGADPDLGAAIVTLGFGVSAASLLLLHFGFDGPVTHHMTLPAAVAALEVLESGLDPVAAVVIGGVFGVVGALLGELASRLFLIHGDTYIDPPALAIFPATTLAILLGVVL